jgi:hypothetical protein
VANFPVFSKLFQEVNMTRPNKPRINIFSMLFDLFIDLALMGMGALLYYHFLVYPLGPVGFSPVVINLFGSKELAVLVISGVPFFIGVFSLLKTLARSAKKLTVPPKSK